MSLCFSVRLDSWLNTRFPLTIALFRLAKYIYIYIYIYIWSFITGLNQLFGSVPPRHYFYSRQSQTMFISMYFATVARRRGIRNRSTRYHAELSDVLLIALYVITLCTEVLLQFVHSRLVSPVSRDVKRWHLCTYRYRRQQWQIASLIRLAVVSTVGIHLGSRRSSTTCLPRPSSICFTSTRQ